MKKAQSKARLRSALAGVTALLLLLSGCSGTAGEADGEKKTPEEHYGAPLTLQAGDNLVASNGSLSLSLNKESMGIIVADSRTNEVWRSNPEHPEYDQDAYGSSVDMLRAQFQLQYYDKNGNLKTVNSYTDCVKLEQATVYALDNGIAVHYLVGDMTRTVADVPTRIADDRFRAVILEKLDQTDAAEMQSYYKFYDDDQSWGLRPRGKNNYVKVLALLDKAGYTTEDLEADNAAFGISSDAASKVRFEVVVEYRLDGEELSVSIPTDKLVYLDDFPLYQIKLLENFATAENGDDGYILLPDGSGSLIEFDETVVSRDLVSIPIYEADGTIQTTSFSTMTQSVCLPVFGLKKNDSGVLGVIESGEASASIEAYRAGRNNENYAVYPVFNVVNMDFVYLSGNDALATVPAFQKKLFDGSYTVNYRFLAGEDATYVGMAKAYRRKLESEGKLTRLSASTGVPMVVDTIGGVYGYKSFLGISYIGLTAATTYTQNIDILKALEDAGIKDVSLKLSGWFNGGYKHTYASKIKLDGELGGRSGLNSLLAYCKESGVTVYPDVDLLTVPRKGNGFTPVFDAARYLDATEASVPDISLATKLQKADNGLKDPFRYILSVGRLPKLTTQFMSAFGQYGFSALSLRTMGSELYSDYDQDETYSRVTAQKIVTEQLEAIKAQTDTLMINKGHAYALPYAAVVTGAPVDHSNFLLTDRAVPFYEIVTHGYVDLTGPLMNTADDAEDTALRCIEYGVGLQYQLIYQPSSFMKNTEYDQLYTANYQDLIPTIASLYSQVSGALSGVRNAAIEEHDRLTDTLGRTVYDNGVCVYVNYGDQAAEADGVSVPAHGYAVSEKKGG